MKLYSMYTGKEYNCAILGTTVWTHMHEKCGCGGMAVLEHENLRKMQGNSTQKI